jgi:hypothetical protein
MWKKAAFPIILMDIILSKIVDNVFDKLFRVIISVILFMSNDAIVQKINEYRNDIVMLDSV